MVLWNGLGQVASITQLAGVDAYGLIKMIVDAAQTAKRNRDTCQKLARRIKMIGNLLQQLQSTELMQHPETRNPVKQLEETLRHTYMLILSCQDSSYLHSCFMGGKQAHQLHEVQTDITFYLQLFPLVSFIHTTRTWERLLTRAHPLCIKDSTNQLHTVHQDIGVLVDEKKRTSLNWSKRLKIIEGISDGLLYLHTHSDMCIVHRDIKASNILLDHEMNAKISDFGLARKLAPNATAEVLVQGTWGYADPEYVATGIISDKTDVYSFGIVLLEIALKNRKKLQKLVDPSLIGGKKHERAQIMQCLRVAMLCIRARAEHRPTMSEVVTMLPSSKTPNDNRKTYLSGRERTWMHGCLPLYRPV
uniref:Protein kinase domain-containing protein n=1 Tax=Leersia perrieri TaxID=77586 RepID=A0A0D9XV73_9ORYZ